jgi:hypothetical protein
MTKIVLNDVTGGYNLSVINDNFQKIADELDDKVLYRDNPVGEPNSLQTDIDLNGHHLLNVGGFSVDGIDFQDLIDEAHAQADASAVSASNSQTSATNSQTSANASAASAVSSANSATAAGAAVSSLNLPVISGADAGKPLIVNPGGTGYVTTPMSKSLIGLSNVDNTSDLNKPLSTAVLARIGSEGALSFRNRVINGSMRVNQRGSSGSTITPSTYIYVADRWIAYSDLSGIGAGNIGSIPASVISQIGSPNAISVLTPASSSTPTGSQSINLQHRMEGTHIADWQWGTPSAKAVSVSFWAYSSVAGTYTAFLKSGGSARSFLHAFTLAASTWTYVSFSIPGDTGGTWNIDTSVGAVFGINLAAGTTLRSSTTDAWIAGNFDAASSASQFSQSASAAFYLTGVQIEMGTTATPFEIRPYGIEVLQCQRYFYQRSAQILQTYNVTSGISYQDRPHPVIMRATPSVAITPTSNSNAGNASVDTVTSTHMRLTNTITSAGSGYSIFDYTVSAEL